MNNATKDNALKQKEVNDALWRACDAFRNLVDSSEYKNYVLIMLFVKYISDVWRERYDELNARYGGNAEIVERQMERQRFILPEKSSFDYLYRRANDDSVSLGELIDIALEHIEDANRAKLEGVFRNVSFNSDALGTEREKNRRLRNLMNAFAALDLRPSRVSEDIIGNGYMFLIENFASEGGKKGGEYYTPRAVSELLAKLVRPDSGDRIYDPTAGSGSLLIRVADEVPNPSGEPSRHNYSLFGQEVNSGTWALCRLNMFLHEEDSAIIKRGDTLNNPQLTEVDRLMRFDIVVANPPFSLDRWGAEHAAEDVYKRFWRGVPPKSVADYAFISHMIESALPGKGRVGVIAPHGVLFRGGAEGRIRKAFIDENLLDAVIGLPEKLFFGTGIPAVILVFDRARETGYVNDEEDDILFIDASRDFAAGKNQNALRPSDIARIVETHRNRAEIPRYSRRVPRAEIAENEYNLNIPRYIDTFDAPEAVDLSALQTEIDALEHQLVAVRARLSAHLKALEVIP